MSWFSMFDPSKALSQILTNVTSNVQPPRPQLSSLFDCFVKNYSDLIHPAVIEKWTEIHGTIQTARMNNESSFSFSNEGFYSIPGSFFDQVALEIFDSLSDADQLQIQQANERAYHDAVIEYKDEMKKLYRAEGSYHGEYGALEMFACVLEPVMAALEAITDLHMIGWAGGSASTSNGIGIIKYVILHFQRRYGLKIQRISSQCGGHTEPPMVFSRSNPDLVRHAAQQWMAQVEGQVIDQWLNIHPHTSAEQGLTKIVMKRKNVGDDIRLVKKTKTADTSNIAIRHNAKISSLSLPSTPELTQSSSRAALQTSSLKDQMIGSQNFEVRRALPPFFAVRTPARTPLRSVLALQTPCGRQSSSTDMRHRSESLFPIQTLNQDDGSKTHRSQGTWEASEGVRLLIRKRGQNIAGVTADEEYRNYFSPLIATIPTSAKNLHDGLRTVIKVDLGSAFRDIVTSLIEIETLHDFRSPKRGLPTRLRPYEVSHWIAAGRGRQGGRVTVVDIKQFSEAWWNWWTDMQPNWREYDAHGKPKQLIPVQVEEDWMCLHKPGANGMISIVAGLSGWGVAIKRQAVPFGLGDKKIDWLCAVEDCHWVMERLIKYLKKKKEEDWSDGHGYEEDELDVETMDGDYDYMQDDGAYWP
ncbi:hypothetical protein C0993_006038 [Termitomyces sp. T159_Od127]|nr:hypothetical protein C0993_006038 [Termitomyces sp. T159_Od127]